MITFCDVADAMLDHANAAKWGFQSARLESLSIEEKVLALLFDIAASLRTIAAAEKKKEEKEDKKPDPVPVDPKKKKG